MDLRIAQSALEDFQDIVDFYDSRGVRGVGVRFVTDILEAFERLKVHPDSGRLVPEIGSESLREIIYPPFRVVYERDERGIVLIRVFRSERQIDVSVRI